MITIKEIAENTGVSSATVSRVLNNDATLSVSDKTRSRIIQYARKHGYKTVNERKGRITLTYGQPGNRRIGVALMHGAKELLEDAYYMALKQMVDETCFEQGVSSVVVSRDDAGHFHTVDSGKLDGIIAIGHFSKDEVNDFRDLTKNIVFMGSESDANMYYSVVPNWSQAIRILLNHCVEKGVKSVAFLGPNESYGENKSLAPDPKYYMFKALLYVIYPYDTSMNITPALNQDCYNETIEFFSNKKKEEYPDVIVVGNDIHVPGLMKALRELKIKVPEDIGVVTINNSGNSVNCDPPLTSVELNPKEQAVSAIMCLQSLWQGITAAKKVVVPGNLVDRKSLM